MKIALSFLETIPLSSYVDIAAATKLPLKCMMS